MHEDRAPTARRRPCTGPGCGSMVNIATGHERCALCRRREGVPERARIRSTRLILISGAYPRREYRLCQAVVVAEESGGAVLLVELTGEPDRLHCRGRLVYVPLVWALPMAAE